MRLPTGVSVVSLLRDILLLVTFFAGFGAAWTIQELRYTKKEVKEQKAVIVDISKAEKTSASTAADIQSFNEKTIKKGHSYVETINSCPEYSDSEFGVLNSLVQEANNSIQHPSGVSGNSASSKQKR